MYNFPARSRSRSRGGKRARYEAHHRADSSIGYNSRPVMSSAETYNVPSSYPASDPARPAYPIHHPGPSYGGYRSYGRETGSGHDRRYHRRGRSRERDYRRAPRGGSYRNDSPRADGRQDDRDRGNNRRGRTGDQALPFDHWVRSVAAEEGNDKEGAKPLEEQYQEYVEQFRKRKDEYFVMEHEDEDWFKSKYSLEARMKRHKDRLDDARSVAKAFVSEFQVPTLEASEKLVSATEVLRKRKNPGSKSIELKAEDLVGEEFPNKKIAFIPRIPPKVSQETLFAGLVEKLKTSKEPEGSSKGDEFAETDSKPAAGEDGNVESSEIATGALESTPDIQLYLGDVNINRRNYNGSPLTRPGWVMCESEEVLQQLIKGGTLALRIPISEEDKGAADEKGANNGGEENNEEGAPKSQVEIVNLPIEMRKVLGNRVAPVEASLPNRVAEDIEKAFEIAKALDQEARLGAGLPSEESTEEQTLEPLPGLGIEAVLESDKCKEFIDKDLPEDEAPVSKAVAYVQRCRKLDVILTYLRRVHFVCYYSHTRFNDLGSMLKSSSTPFLRMPLLLGKLQKLKKSGTQTESVEDAQKSEGQSEDQPLEGLEKLLSAEDLTEQVGARTDSRWIANLDRSIKSILADLSSESLKANLEQDKKDEEELQKLKESAIESFCNQNTKAENGAFRCLLPPYKLFKSEEFVHKYIRSKHKPRLQLVEKMAAAKLTSDIFKRESQKQRAKQLEFKKYLDANRQNSMGNGNKRRAPRTYNQRQGRRPAGMHHNQQHPAVGQGAPRQSQWAGGRRYNDYDAPPPNQNTVEIKYRTKVDYSDL